MNELYKVHRPKLLKQVLGQNSTIKVLNDLVKRNEIPHSVLFSGPSGCGKTTLARILSDKLKCGPTDFTEVNSSDFRGIDTVRDIRNYVHARPISGPVRVWLLDEVHMLTKDAQNAFLKILEDTPKQAYFFLCTTEPTKLIKALRSRCTHIQVQRLDNETLENLIAEVAKKEKAELDDEVVQRIIEHSDGSARNALVHLHKVIGLETTEERLAAIVSPELERDGYDLIKLLLNPGTKWESVVKFLKQTTQEPEGMRQFVLSNATTVMLNDKPQKAKTARAYIIIDVFREPIFDSTDIARKAGFVAACWEVISSK